SSFPFSRSSMGRDNGSLRRGTEHSSTDDSSSCGNRFGLCPRLPIAKNNLFILWTTIQRASVRIPYFFICFVNISTPKNPKRPRGNSEKPRGKCGFFPNIQNESNYRCDNPDYRRSSSLLVGFMS
ncbi:hypothetical protein PENTCL1PPCAC_20715, partial [Pristionchus entomophagus]